MGWPMLIRAYYGSDHPQKLKNTARMGINQGRIQSKISEGVQNFQGGALFRHIK